MKRKQTIMMAIKYCYFIVIMCLGAYTKRDIVLGVEGILELCTIFILSNMLFNISKTVARAVNFLLLLFYGIEITVLKLGGSFVTPIMLTNISSLSALSGKTLSYVLHVVLFLLALLIPLEKVEISHGILSRKRISISLMGINMAVVTTLGSSPLTSALLLGNTMYQMRKMSEERNRQQNTITITDQSSKYYSSTIGDYRESEFEELPDVLIIFTEGLSQNIIDDSRNIMPNVREYQNRSLTFENYYNHTAATYRGLIGQLYSGHQYENTDTNAFISLQAIMSSYGYETTFINPEPNNEEFSAYLCSMGFDQVISADCADWMSDRETYHMIYESLIEETDNPKLISVYTFGTHVSMDRSEYQFGDGTDHVLNRFHNVDYYFGELMEKIASNPDLENTLVVFTTDHATYVDEDFLKAFADFYSRDDSFCDEIPLFFYYSGITPEKMDVGGRNSLDAAPTILDYLDMDGENYFLGDSWFSPRKDSISIDMIHSIPNQGWYVSTYDGMICELTEEEQQLFIPEIIEYTNLANYK